ncbi:MAG: DUF3568 family protein [Planctomycetota bacterium]|nr:MAG: DUF3568 family protein [Planctomycetota bacterium]
MDRRPLKHAVRLTLYLLAVGVALASSGCLLIAAGAAGGAAVGYVYYKGAVCATYNAGFADAFTASQAALRDLGMPIVLEEKKAAEGFLESRTADGERIRIYVEPLTSKIPAEAVQTRISVRVATFGDRPLSERILDQVGLHLTPVTAVPQPFAGQPAASGITQTAAPPAAGSPSRIGPPQSPPPPISSPEPPTIPR